MTKLLLIVFGLDFKFVSRHQQ